MMFAATPEGPFVLLLSVTSLIVHAAASVRPRVPATLLGPAQGYVVAGAVDGPSGLVARANGCPVGWAVCSAITCYPLDGSQCCSDGDFCPSGSVCESGGCCPIGEICDGSAPPPITVGSGNVPTDTETFVPLPTTTRRLPTTSTRPATRTPTPTSTLTPTPTTDSFGDPLGITVFSTTPDVSVTVTTPTSFPAAGTEPGENPVQTTSDVPQFPFGGTGGAPPGARVGRMGAVLTGMFVVLVNIV